MFKNNLFHSGTIWTRNIYFALKLYIFTVATPLFSDLKIQKQPVIFTSLIFELEIHAKIQNNVGDAVTMENYSMTHCDGHCDRTL